jgi:hypothetical protein
MEQRSIQLIIKNKQDLRRNSEIFFDDMIHENN